MSDTTKLEDWDGKFEVYDFDSKGRASMQRLSGKEILDHMDKIQLNTWHNICIMRNNKNK